MKKNNNNNINKEEKNIKVIYKFDKFEFIAPDKKGLGLGETDVTVVEKKVQNKKGKNIYILEFYKDGKLIANTNEKGELNFSKKYKEMLKQNLKGYYDILKLDKREHVIISKDDIDKRIEEEQKELQKNKKSKVKQEKKEDKKQEKADKKNEENKKDEIKSEDIEEELGLQKGDIESTAEIIDKRFYDKVPEAKKFDGYAKLAYSKSRNEFIIVGKNNGKIVEAETILPGKGTMKTSVDLDNNGDPVKSKAISAIMQLKGSNEYDFAVNLNSIGTIEFQELRWDDVNKKYMSSDLDTNGKVKQRTSKEVDRMMKNTENNNITDEIDKYEKLKSKGKVNIDEIKDEEKSEKNNTDRYNEDDDGLPPIADPYNPKKQSRL